MRDRVVARVFRDLEARENKGLRTYGTTISQAGLTKTELLRHAYEEALDLAVYLAAAMEEAEREDAPGTEYRG